MTKRTARPPKPDTVPLKLAGKTIAFTGRGSYQPGMYGPAIEAEGGKIVADVSADLDYLVVGQARGRTAAQKEADRLNQKHGAAIQIIDEADFRQLFLPTREEALALLSGGETAVERWNRLRELCRWQTPLIDLSNVDLRGVNFHRANLQQVTLDDADLRDADLTGVWFGELRNVKLDGARLLHGGVSHAHGCTFRKADLSEAHLNPASYQDCDFTGASLRKVFGSYTQAASVIFRKADLGSASLEDSKFQQAEFSEADLSEARLCKCDFTGAILKGANLRKADLTDAKLVNADLSKADLRETILAGADLTGATISQANFTGANIVGATVAGLDAASAIGLDPAAASAGGRVGPSIRELEKLAAQSRRLETFAIIDMPDHPVELRLTCQNNARWINTYTGTPAMGYHSNTQALGTGMIDLARRWTNGTLRIASITAKISKGPVSSRELLGLARAAWFEACAMSRQSEEEIAEQLQAENAEADQLRLQMLQELRGGPEGIKRWNARCGTVPWHCRSVDERQKVGHFRRVDLSGLDLSGAMLGGGLDFQGAVFDGASLVQASLDYGDFRKASFRNANLTSARCGIAKFSGADFTGASLHNAHLRACTFSGTVFAGADLRGADFGQSDLRGADLSGADLRQAKFEHTTYNEQTRLPAGFTHIEGMEWKGAGPPPGAAPAPAATQAAEAIDFETLMERLPRTVDASSLAKALQMLKADRFQLYAEVKEEVLVGVVKSQSNPTLVYSCRLGADGVFSCGTQNLRACGGLHGRLCKHLLVLLVGLAKSGQLEPGTADLWAQASRKQKPTLDKEAMSETFLRYKGAEAGEVDWRPTETIPEDYYAL